MVEKPTEVIGEDEAALYDRQIRLWGLDAQNRLRNGAVLLVGLSGLGAEVAKNLALAGVKSLTLMDNEVTTEEDTFAQFLAPADCVGQNRANVSVKRCQELNPLVSVTAEECDVSTKDEEFFKQFDVVCLIKQSFDEMVRLDKICRKLGKKFCAGGVWGWFGYCLMDFLDHQFAEEVIERADEEEENGDGPKAKKSRSDEKKSHEETVVMVKKVEEFPPIDQFFRMDWSEFAAKNKLKRTSMSYFIVQILMGFHEREGRYPQRKFDSQDRMLLLKLKDNLIRTCKLDPETEIIPDNFVNFCYSELSPVCAITGGVLSQEIIKAVSQKDQPINNSFFYNGMDSSALVSKFPLKY